MMPSARMDAAGGSKAEVQSAGAGSYNTKYSNVARYTAAPGAGRTRYSNFDKFDNQDAAIEAFRRFATLNDVNVVLVIHPRKEDDRAALSEW